MSEILPKVWKNGQEIDFDSASPSIASISFHMGTGVFDGMMAYWIDDKHCLFRAEDHFIRFKRSAEQMGMRISWSIEELCAAAYSIASKGEGQTCYIRPIAYRGGPELWLTGSEKRPVDVTIFAVPTSRLLNKPLTCHLSGVQRVSNKAMPISWKVCGLYVNSFLTRKQAELDGYDDGIMLDSEGFVTEAAAANIFIIGQQRLITPPLNGDVFPGITRDTIFQLCDMLQIDCIEAPLLPEDVTNAEAAFLCSTLMEIRPISGMSGKTMHTASNPLYNSISSAFDNVVSGILQL